MDVLSVLLFGPAFVGGCVWVRKNFDLFLAGGVHPEEEEEEDEAIELDIHAMYWNSVERNSNGTFTTRGE